MLERRPSSSMIWLAGLIALSFAVAAVSLIVLKWQAHGTAQTRADASTRGDGQRGRHAVARYGCGACHTIPGIKGATGQVGPDLTHISRRTTIAGQYPNQPDAMIRWLMHPQHYRPRSGMPEMGISEQDARDIGAYLYGRD